MSGKKKIVLFVILPVIIFVSFFIVCLLSAAEEKQSYRGTFVTALGHKVRACSSQPTLLRGTGALELALKQYN